MVNVGVAIPGPFETVNAAVLEPQSNRITPEPGDGWVSGIGEVLQATSCSCLGTLIVGRVWLKNAA